MDSRSPAASLRSARQLALLNALPADRPLAHDRALPGHALFTSATRRIPAPPVSLASVLTHVALDIASPLQGVRFTRLLALHVTLRTRVSTRPPTPLVFVPTCPPRIPLPRCLVSAEDPMSSRARGGMMQPLQPPGSRSPESGVSRLCPAMHDATLGSIAGLRAYGP